MNFEGKTENPRRFSDGMSEEIEGADNEQATPEEQEDYDLLTVRARKIIFGEGKEGILEMLGSSETPAQAMGAVGSMIVKSLTQSAKQSGRDISPLATFEAFGDIAVDLNELAKKNGVFEYDSEQDEYSELADAMVWSAKHYGDGLLQSGELTPELQQMAAEEVQTQLAQEQGLQQAAPAEQAMPPPGGLVGNAMGGY